ncbi:hypothetical protein JZ751_004422 [Albula glossodonta]|uniref:Uncharacterized protein n=1 Tax=Albula glossodonta TaxID=121402 RepID=A0A8T2N6G5_9TELE|nr:hypothetical protein JZ751_004422 [Albula glossodonta]
MGCGVNCQRFQEQISALLLTQGGALFYTASSTVMNFDLINLPLSGQSESCCLTPRSDGEGFCCLHLAVLFQHMPIAAYLMAKGQCNASVNAVDKVKRNSPLHCAVLAGNVDAVHILLEAGASVDLQNSMGHTPIDLAHQVHSPLLIYMLNHIKQERIKSNLPCFRVVNKNKFHLQLLFSIVVMWLVGAITDMHSESWLLKGVLLACLLAVVNIISRSPLLPWYQVTLEDTLEPTPQALEGAGWWGLFALQLTPALQTQTSGVTGCSISLLETAVFSSPHLCVPHPNKTSVHGSLSPCSCRHPRGDHPTVQPHLRDPKEQAQFAVGTLPFTTETMTSKLSDYAFCTGDIKALQQQRIKEESKENFWRWHVPELKMNSEPASLELCWYSSQGDHK